MRAIFTTPQITMVFNIKVMLNFPLLEKKIPVGHEFVYIIVSDCGQQNLKCCKLCLLHIIYMPCSSAAAGCRLPTSFNYNSKLQFKLHSQCFNDDWVFSSNEMSCNNQLEFLLKMAAVLLYIFCMCDKSSIGGGVCAKNSHFLCVRSTRSAEQSCSTIISSVKKSEQRLFYARGARGEAFFFVASLEAS